MPDLDAAWSALEGAAKEDGRGRIVDRFAAEPDRLARMTVDAAGLHLDLSKQSWSAAGLDAALALAEAADIEHARAFERAISDSTLSVIAGAGHAITVEQSDELSKTVVSFIDQHDA